MSVSTTTFIVELFILFGAALIAGEIATRLGQAALVGQLLVGVVLGPTLLGSTVFGQYLDLSSSNVELTGIQLLATFFVLLTAGLDVRPEEIFESGPQAITLGLSVFVGPFLIGALVIPFLFPGVTFLTALFISLTLSITALPVMAIMLVEFGLARSKMGLLLMNTAVINELAAVTVFAILLRLTTTSGVAAVAIAIVSIGVFLTTVLAVHFGLRALRESKRWSRGKSWFRSNIRTKEAGFALLLAMALGSALYSQYLGLTFLVGAFYAGLLITPESAGPREHRSISQVFDAISWGFFVPLFFAFVGLDMNLTLLDVGALAVLGALIAFALSSKLALATGLARLFGWGERESVAIGFMVSSRGAVELAMAVILLQVGVFTEPIYTLVAAVGLVTTILAPIGAVAYGGLTRGGPMAGLRKIPRPETSPGSPLS
jgi:Kef-type K+ transport system membrane component KefB